MMQTSKENTTTSTRKPKIIQQLQPDKICNCGACEPRKQKLEAGKRRLKVSTKMIVHERGWVKTDSAYSYVPQIRIEGQWLRNTGFESGQHVIITQQKGKLIIELENESGVD